jgi:hypothetical protein
MTGSSAEAPSRRVSSDIDGLRAVEKGDRIGFTSCPDSQGLGLDADKLLHVLLE